MGSLLKIGVLVEFILVSLKEMIFLALEILEHFVWLHQGYLFLEQSGLHFQAVFAVVLLFVLEASFFLGFGEHNSIFSLLFVKILLIFRGLCLKFVYFDWLLFIEFHECFDFV